MLRVLDPIEKSPFVVPTIRKEAPTGNALMGTTPLKAVTNRFPQVGEPNFRGSRGRFQPIPPMTPQKPPSVHQLEVASVLSEETGK